MDLAYVDSSCLVAIALGEPGGTEIGRRFKQFDELLSSTLLEAEFRAALRREGLEPPATPLPLSWLIPDRPLTAEISRVLAAGYLRGADCWHLATALYFAAAPPQLTFLTLDDRQMALAQRLGFRT
jgi:predicted nucleic acid-binding protein